MKLFKMILSVLLCAAIVAGLSFIALPCAAESLGLHESRLRCEREYRQFLPVLRETRT